jgi:hypothetical protein
VKQLVDDALRERLDHRALIGIELVELGAEPFELARAHTLAELAQRRDERGDFASRPVGAVPLDLGGEDLTHLADLPPAPLRGTLRIVLEVVEVEEGHVVDFTHARIDVARERNIDDEQRSPAAARHHHLDGRAFDEYLR